MRIIKKDAIIEYIGKRYTIKELTKRFNLDINNADTVINFINNLKEKKRIKIIDTFYTEINNKSSFSGNEINLNTLVKFSNKVCTVLEFAKEFEIDLNDEGVIIETIKILIKQGKMEIIAENKEELTENANIFRDYLRKNNIDDECNFEDDNGDTICYIALPLNCGVVVNTMIVFDVNNIKISIYSKYLEITNVSEELYRYINKINYDYSFAKFVIKDNSIYVVTHYIVSDYNPENTTHYLKTNCNCMEHEYKNIMDIQSHNNYNRKSNNEEENEHYSLDEFMNDNGYNPEYDSVDDMYGLD